MRLLSVRHLLIKWLFSTNNLSPVLQINLLYDLGDGSFYKDPCNDFLLSSWDLIINDQHINNLRWDKLDKLSHFFSNSFIKNSIITNSFGVKKYTINYKTVIWVLCLMFKNRTIKTIYNIWILFIKNIPQNHHWIHMHEKLQSDLKLNALYSVLY